MIKEIIAMSVTYRPDAVICLCHPPKRVGILIGLFDLFVKLCDGRDLFVSLPLTRSCSQKKRLEDLK